VQTDILVLGAGPAGSAAAIALARAGARVVIADRAAFPREKICGDGLLPDALAQLDQLGALAQVEGVARRVPTFTMRSASGLAIRFDIGSLVLPRRELDAILLARALDSGAELLSQATLTGVVGDGVAAARARFATPQGEVEVAARAYVLATGAAVRPRAAFGLPTRGIRPAAALRGYARVTGLPDDELLIALLGEVRHGYAWAFPGPDGIWNVGCGVFAGSAQERSLHATLERFLVACGGTWITPPRGAPLVTSFPRLACARGNVLAVGDAVGLTRPFSGEGIGPALASGALAATALLSAGNESPAVCYRHALVARFARDFRAWRFGEIFLRAPRLVDLIIRRTLQLPGAQRRCAALLGGTLPANRVLSPAGLLRLLIGA
jgi:geranylgeranyl reductase family protein